MSYKIGDIVLTSIPGITEDLVLARIVDGDKAYGFHVQSIESSDHPRDPKDSDMFRPRKIRTDVNFGVMHYNIARRATREDIEQRFVDLL